MKAISLWQPWASAVALGYKHNETRHWQTNYRGLIAIHAAKLWRHDVQKDLAARYGMRGLPFGQFVAVANLFNIMPTEIMTHCISDIERDFGVYDPQRFAWLLTDIRPLARPFGYRGGQGMFNVPDDLIEGAL